MDAWTEDLRFPPDRPLGELCEDVTTLLGKEVELEEWKSWEQKTEEEKRRKSKQKRGRIKKNLELKTCLFFHSFISFNLVLF